MRRGGGVTSAGKSGYQRLNKGLGGPSGGKRTVRQGLAVTSKRAAPAPPPPQERPPTPTTQKLRAGRPGDTRGRDDRAPGVCYSAQKRGDGVCPPPPRVTFRLVAVSLRGPGQSPVRPFACCVGSLRSVGRCGRCSCWCRFRVRRAQWLGLCWMWRVPFVRQRCPVGGILGLCWLLRGPFGWFPGLRSLKTRAEYKSNNHLTGGSARPQCADAL